MHAPEFNLYDTPETVAKDALRPTASAFVDIIRQLDSMPRVIPIENFHFSGPHGYFPLT